MRDEEYKWNDIDKTRIVMLNNSDWTQLPDTNLTNETVQEWQKWRLEIRKVTQKNYDRPIPAILELKKLQISKPDNEYSSGLQTYTRKGPIISRTEITSKIKDVLENMGLTSIKKSPIEPVELPTEDILDTIDDIKVGKEYALRELEAAYLEQIRDSSPPLDLIHLHTERLNQAIDCLSDIGTSFPLLEVLSKNLNKSIKEVATTILKKQNETIKKFANIELNHIECLKKIKESVTISGLKKALEKFNGH